MNRTKFFEAAARIQSARKGKTKIDGTEAEKIILRLHSIGYGYKRMARESGASVKLVRSLLLNRGLKPNKIRHFVAPYTRQPEERWKMETAFRLIAVELDEETRRVHRFSSDRFWVGIEWNRWRASANAKRRYAADPKSHNEKVKVNRAKNPAKYAAMVKAWKYSGSEKAELNLLATNLRVRILSAVKAQSSRKHHEFNKLLGCSVREFRQHIERQFKKGMNWENHGSHWHIDHIIPCAAFNLRDANEQLRCFNWNNMRPLEKGQNMRKSAKIIEPQQSLLL